MFKKEVMLMNSKSQGGVIKYEISQKLVNMNCSCFVYLNDEKLDLDTASGSFEYSIDDEILFELWFNMILSEDDESRLAIRATGGSIVCLDNGLINALATGDPSIIIGSSYMYQFFPTGGYCTVNFSWRTGQYGGVN